MISLAAVEMLAGDLWPNAPSAVVAAPDPRKGERLILVTQQKDATRSQFIAFARERHASELMIPAEIMILDKMPMLGSGKVDMMSLNKLVQEHMAAQAAGGGVGGLGARVGLAAANNRSAARSSQRWPISSTFLALIAAFLFCAVWMLYRPDHARALVFPFVFIGFVISLCLHEFGHAIVAYHCGDRTVRDKGYLTLDPLRYTDLQYSIVFPLIIMALGGIGLPGGAVYINLHYLRRPSMDRWCRRAVRSGRRSSSRC